MSSILEEGPREIYEETKNPAYIWELIDFLAPAYASGRREFPDWVRNYICESAANIMKLNRTGKKYPVEIYKALGKPLQSTISTSIKRKRDDRISLLIQEENAKGSKLDKCYELMADMLELEANSSEVAYKKHHKLEVDAIEVIYKAYRKRENEANKYNDPIRDRDDYLSSLIQWEISEGKTLEECCEQISESYNLNNEYLQKNIIAKIEI